MSDNNKNLQKFISEAKKGGGEKRIARQHEKKKLTARERIEYLLDEGSFEEMGMLVTHRTTDFGMQDEVYYGDGVVTGYGTVNGDRKSTRLNSSHVRISYAVFCL